MRVLVRVNRGFVVDAITDVPGLEVQVLDTDASTIGWELVSTTLCEQPLAFEELRTKWIAETHR